VALGLHAVHRPCHVPVRIDDEGRALDAQLGTVDLLAERLHVHPELGSALADAEEMLLELGQSGQRASLGEALG
jgi:hypothetical protein